MGFDGIPLGMLKELADVIVRLLSVFEWSWKSGEVPVEWKLINIVLVFKKHRKGDPGDCRPISLTSEPGKVVERYGKTPEASCY